MQKDIDPGAADCPLIALHRKICLDAARDMITHIHRSFELAPGLRRWSFYCLYCLQATLVLLPQSADNRDAADDIFCARAVEVFEQIKLKASQRCAEVVRQYLRKRAEARQQRQRRGTATDPADNTDHTLQLSRPASTLQQKPEPASAVSYLPPGQDRSRNQVASGMPNSGLTAASVPCFDDGDASWPSISPTLFQTEMYGALYSVDPSDEFYLGHQPYFFGTAGFSNDTLTDDTNDWSHPWSN